MSWHAILKNLCEPKMDVILTISFKINWAEIEITNICFVSYFPDEDVHQRFEKHNYVLSFIHCHGICVYIVFLLLIARLLRLAIISPAEVSFKRHEIKDFSPSLRKQPLWWGWRFFFFFLSFFFFPFFVLLFSINIYLNNCYLIKCNRQQEKYRVSSPTYLTVYYYSTTTVQ